MAGRGKKLALNTITSLILQLVTVVCGFILPRLILESFGSDVNGLVNSITQFLGVITLLDLGVGAVVQSALYKPLTEKDTDMISKIYVSANKFFRRLAEILLVSVMLGAMITSASRSWAVDTEAKHTALETFFMFCSVTFLWRYPA